MVGLVVGLVCVGGDDGGGGGIVIVGCWVGAVDAGKCEKKLW